jgi:hypothetical protein
LTQAKRFAAIAPICGNANPARLKKLSPKQIEAIFGLSTSLFQLSSGSDEKTKSAKRDYSLQQSSG